MKIWPNVSFKAKSFTENGITTHIVISETELRKKGEDGKWYRIYLNTRNEWRDDPSDPRNHLEMHMHFFNDYVYRHILGWKPDPRRNTLDEDQRSEEQRMNMLKPSDPAAV